MGMSVLFCVLQVGPTYGRKTMVGVLASQGIRTSSQCVGVPINSTHVGHPK